MIFRFKTFVLRQTQPAVPRWGAALLACAWLSACTPSGPDASAETAQASAKAPRALALARGKIDVEGGLLELSAGSEGLVQQLLVKEGQRVRSGQVLLHLADAAAQAESEVAAAQLQLAEKQLAAHTARLPRLEQSLARWQTAASQGAADAQQVEEAAQALRDAQSEQAIAKAEVQLAQQKRAQLRAQLSRLELRAPEAAEVVRVYSHTGAYVAPGARAVVLLPQKPLLVRAELNEAFAAVVREGMPAKVVIDGDAGAAQSLPSAKVLRISPIYGIGRLQEDTQRGPVRVIEAVLAFDEPPKARVGQNVRVTFHE